ncbi:MAG TPA: hypothetical protein VF932_04425 [Anaerolineae bacterium]
MKSQFGTVCRLLGGSCVLVLLLLSLLLSAYSLGENHSTATPAAAALKSAERIAFVRNDSVSAVNSIKRLYIMNADGSGLTSISQDIQAWDIAWSPDGNRIAFTCPLDNNLEICAVDADGSHPVRLTNNTGDDLNPTWSPDGRQITFASNRDGNFQIYSMNCDGSGLNRLTHTSANEMQPAWSPDGRSIAFTSDRANKNGIRPNRDIFVMDAKGMEQTNLTHNATACVSEFPAWSPDGAQIAFDSNCQGAWFQVYVMRSDGSHFRRITNSEGHDRHPTWSPDGRQIAFDSNRNLADPGRRLLKDESEVYLVSLDNGAETQLTSCAPKFSGRPAWAWTKASPEPDK